ncbi:Glycosyltransferase family 9 (heptosyltransferase) [Caballeronia arvi]|uniref:Glycosyltransferase family 9 (Heptosyltransferase) n=1 Tax=Caballeronia arvi TaxID=1777135 RepID=A0A158KEE2_9BURK|nr:glycosyltransferase family 9 protein [Caballeronia arvi]SAL79103.1 Glycosyltransferase family 9 (heptosyltransferase) [Caballeronia arvi]
MNLRTDSSIAVVLPSPIGDSLIGLVLVNNLLRNGYRPVVFGWVAEQLADWFPHVTVAQPDAWQGAFDTVIELLPTDYAAALSRSGETLCLATLPEYRGSKHMVDRIVEVATKVFGLRDVTRANGLAVPAGVVEGRFANRIAIHPTGSHPEKMWGRAKFLALSRGLAHLHWQPSFLVAPAEFGAWGDIASEGCEINALPRLGEVATWIAESSWFIGNDSGLGHLASCIGVPTLSLFMRRGLARSWRPGWGPGAVVLPLSVLPFGALRERMWQRLLTVRRVMTAFQMLHDKHARAQHHYVAADFADAKTRQAERIGMLPGAQSRRL